MDIVQRLRLSDGALELEAAREIEELRAELIVLSNFMRTIRGTAAMALSGKHAEMIARMGGEYGD
jgi:hypothetical protein